MFTYCADNPITFSDPSGRYYRYMDPVVGPGLVIGESPAASPAFGGGASSNPTGRHTTGRSVGAATGVAIGAYIGAKIVYHAV